MNNKYYIPSIEEFRVGFIYEEENNPNEWVSRIIEDAEDLAFFCDNWHHDAVPLDFRVKYLDREDIESLGFYDEIYGKFFYKMHPDIITNSNEYFLNNDWVRFNDYELHYDFVSKQLLITDYNREVLFNGICKNKSELEVILKQIGING